MSFETILHEILNECGGGLGIALMGSDGIPIVQLNAEVSAGNPLGEDIATAGVEFARILAEIQKAADVLQAGSMLEIFVNLSAFQLLFRRIDDDVVLVLALSHEGGNPGKARYLVRRHLGALRQEL